MSSSVSWRVKPVSVSFFSGRGVGCFNSRYAPVDKATNKARAMKNFIINHWDREKKTIHIYSIDFALRER